MVEQPDGSAVRDDVGRRNAAADRDRLPDVGQRLGERREAASADVGGVVRAGVAQEQDEFVAAQPRDDVGVAARAAGRLPGAGDQQLVAAGVLTRSSDDDGTLDDDEDTDGDGVDDEDEDEKEITLLRSEALCPTLLELPPTASVPPNEPGPMAPA